MRLVVSDAAAEVIEEQGGRLFVWPKKAHCCGGLVTLATSTKPQQGEFRRVAASERFELLFPVGLTQMPDELHIEVRRHPRRIEAYWNGCAWVIT
jgi:hypothetical protein